MITGSGWVQGLSGQIHAYGSDRAMQDKCVPARLAGPLGRVLGRSRTVCERRPAGPRPGIHPIRLTKIENPL
jgi:hypothetical protein